jgi:hypothetical protein
MEVVVVLMKTIDRAMDVFSNTFCAGGGVLGNGTFAVFGGNQRECSIRIN